MSFDISYIFEAVDKFSPIAKKMQRSFLGLTKSSKKLNEKYKQMSESMGRMGASMTLKLTAPIVAFGALSTNTFIDFEKSMNMVGAVTNATGDDMASLKKAAMDLGSTTQYTARQVAQAEVYMGLSGQKTQDIIKGLPAVLELAASAQMDMGRASLIVTKMMSGYNFKASELSEVNNVLVKGFTSANVNLENLSKSFSIASSMLHSANISFRESTALIATLSDANVDASTTGTQLRMLIINMMNPTKKMRKELHHYHIALTNVDGSFRSILDTVSELSRKKVASKDIIKMFGKRPGVLVNLLVQQYDKLIARYKALGDTGEIATKVAKSQMKGLVGSVYTLKSALEHVQIVLGDQFEPQLISVTDKLTDFIRNSANSSSKTKKYAVEVAGLVAALGPLLLALGKVVLVFRILAKFGLLPTIILSLGAAFGFLWKRILGPIGLIYVAVKLVMHLYKKFEMVRNVLNAIGKVLKVVFYPIYLAVKAAEKLYHWLHKTSTIGAAYQQAGTAYGQQAVDGTAYGQQAVAGAAMPTPIAAASPNTMKVLSMLDINVNDRTGVIKNVNGKSDGQINYNLGKNMALSGGF